MQKTKSMMVNCAECGKDIKRNVPIGKYRNFFCDMSCKAAYQRRAKLLSRDEIHDLYISQKLGCAEIGKMVGRDPKSIWNWLSDYGIPTRHRGSDVRQQFGKGKEISRGWHHSEETKEKLRQARYADGSKGLFRPNGDHVLKGRTGKDHPRWQGGNIPERISFYHTQKWKDVYRAVWERDNAACQRCGLDHRTVDRTKTKFHVHHIFGYTKYPKLRADIKNLVLLCGPCHRWVHSRKNEKKDWIGHEET